MGQDKSPFILDIKSPNTSIFDVSNGECNNARYDFITPKVNNGIIKLVYGDKPICEFKFSELKYLFTVYDSGSIRLFYVNHKIGFMFYWINDSGEIERINGDGYLRIYYEIACSVPVKEYFTLELTDGTQNHYLAVYKSFRSYHSMSFEPKIGYICKKVTYRGVTIWEAKEDTERCLKSILYSDSRTFLCYVEAYKSHYARFLYYTRTNDGWALIDKETFDSLLKAPSPKPSFYNILKEKTLKRAPSISFDKLKSL